jgi:hypothetical protein
MTPTARSLAYLREHGYVAAIVERWIPGANVRRDLFGILDLVAIRDGETVGVQVTSGSNVAARIRKIEDSPALPHLRAAGWRLLVHGWRKRKGRWTLREVDVS